MRRSWAKLGLAVVGVATVLVACILVARWRITEARLSLLTSALGQPLPPSAKQVVTHRRSGFSDSETWIRAELPLADFDRWIATCDLQAPSGNEKLFYGGTDEIKAWWTPAPTGGARFFEGRGWAWIQYDDGVMYFKKIDGL